MKFLNLLFLMILFNAMDMNAKDFVRVAKDDGSMGTTWLPKELVKKVGDKPTMLIAKCEPEEGARCYVLTYSKRKKGLGNLATGFFRVKDGEVVVLGESESRFPFKKFVKDGKVVDILWKDFLNRWIAKDGREGIQEKLNRRAGKQITKEEVFYFSQAGFVIPENVRQVE